MGFKDLTKGELIVRPSKGDVATRIEGGRRNHVRYSSRRTSGGLRAEKGVKSDLQEKNGRTHTDNPVVLPKMAPKALGLDK